MVMIIDVGYDYDDEMQCLSELITNFHVFGVLMMIDVINLCVCNRCLVLFNDDDDDKIMRLMKL